MLYNHSWKAASDLCSKNETVHMIWKTIELLKIQHFVLLYFLSLPVEGVTIYTQVMLHWMDFPPRT